jgi:fatty acid desaturase
MAPILGCAFILSGFLNAAHDCVHDTHIGRQRLNRVAGAAWCVPILVNFTIYKRQHLVHHHFTGVDGDTEVHAYFSSPSCYLAEHAGWGFWRAIASRIVRTLRFEFPPSISKPRHVAGARLDNMIICGWLTGMGLLTLFFPKIVMVAYWLPLIAYPGFVVFFSLPEHYGLTGEHHEWPRARNVISNPLVRFFQWNANFHAVHHRIPKIPAVTLAEFHGWEANALAEPTERSYLEFHFRVLSELFGTTSLPTEQPHDERIS